MIIVCESCQARYKFDESKLGQRPRAKTKCAKCGSAIEIENPLFGAMTLPPSPEPPPPPTVPPPTAPPTPTVPMSATAPEETTRKTKTVNPPRTDPSASTSQDLMGETSGLELSPGKRYSLAVLQGAATGQIFQITRPRTTVGRAGADINIDDSEASRQHACVEILGDHAILRDLGSTNGTFVESQRIQQHVLTNQGEFRIGSHVVMFIVTDVE